MFQKEKLGITDFPPVNTLKLLVDNVHFGTMTFSTQQDNSLIFNPPSCKSASI